MAGWIPNAMIQVEVLQPQYQPGTGAKERWQPVWATVGGLESRNFPCKWEESAAEDDGAADTVIANGVAVARLRYHPAIYEAASVDTAHLRAFLYGDPSRAYRLVATAVNAGMENRELVLRLRRWTVR